MAQIKTNITVHDTFCMEERTEPCGIVIFGASGDLAHRKLLPALFNLYSRELLPDNFFVVGCARTQKSDEDFRHGVADALVEHGGVAPSEVADVTAFIDHCYYVTGNYTEETLYSTMKTRLQALTEQYKTQGNLLFYLSTPPSLYTAIAKHLNGSGLTVQESNKDSWARVIFEKPFGYDLESAMALDRTLLKLLDEEQIYRIDHFLGKETVQNILILRFANAMFEPVWNRRYIDNIQITAAEDIGIEDRAGYFERAGLLRDMFQNHLLQVMALVGMEPPLSFEADRVRDEKAKLLRAIRPIPLDDLKNHFVRGQYGAGEVSKKPVSAYREESGVAQDSQTETFVAAKLMVDNWRWEGVPFYLRSGKRLPRKVTEVAITFRHIPHSIFGPLMPQNLPPNVLVLNLQPDEGIDLHMQVKRPGPKLCMTSLHLDFNYKEIFEEDMPSPYERLLLDCMLGDQTLFVRHDGVEMAWSLLTPVLQAWEGKTSDDELFMYKAGTWGPEAFQTLLARDHRSWHTK